MLIAHIAPVLTVADHAAADSGNAADVRNGYGIFGAGEGLQGNVRNLHLVLLGCGIDLSFVDTVADHADILADNSSGEVISLHGTCNRGFFNGSGDGIHAHKAANPFAAGNLSVKGAVCNGAGIASR